MTITLETMLGHMGWANQQIFTQISDLPDEALGAYVTHENWNVAEILFHTIVSADRLVFRINGREVTKMTKPTNMKNFWKQLSHGKPGLLRNGCWLASSTAS